MLRLEDFVLRQTGKQQMPSSGQSESSHARTLGSVLGLVIFSGLLGFGSGAFMAHIAPENKFSWAGLAIVPLWLLIEAHFEDVVGALGSHSKIVRLTTTTTLLAGFYYAWFVLRQ